MTKKMSAEEKAARAAERARFEEEERVRQEQQRAKAAELTDAYTKADEAFRTLGDIPCSHAIRVAERVSMRFAVDVSLTYLDEGNTRAEPRLTIRPSKRLKDSIERLRAGSSVHDIYLKIPDPTEVKQFIAAIGDIMGELVRAEERNMETERRLDYAHPFLRNFYR